MLGEVTQTRVKSLLQAREVRILQPGQLPALESFEEFVRSAAVEVLLLTNSDDPPAGPVRGLAVEAVACETASLIEYSLFPEAQTPDRDGRGYHLHRRYLELLTRLRGIVDAAGGFPADGLVPSSASGRPVGSFPPASPYPEPADGLMF